MLRNRKKSLNKLRKLDAFPKMPKKLMEQSTSGGTVSLFGFAIMGILIVWETAYYLDTKFVFKFDPDTNMYETLPINMDLTVAMPCSSVSADVIDATGHPIETQKDLKMDDVWFELDSDQKAHFSSVQSVNSYLREEYHSIHRLLWKNGYINIFGDMPPRRSIPDHDKDACRIHGSVTLNKVAGNFHIIADNRGSKIQIHNGHAHIQLFVDDHQANNFSHRIEKLSFGDHIPGIVHPLEGDEETTTSKMALYQYFLTVVPTKINTYRVFGNSYQYSVSQQSRIISHDKGSHGTPGIYFKYDFSALQVEVREEHDSFSGFITRIVGIIGGVFTITGVLHRFVGFITSLVFLGSRKQHDSATTAKPHATANLDVTTDIQAPLIATIVPESSESVQLGPS